MIEITLGITGLAPREAIALASTCAVSRAVGRAVGYSLHDWAGSADHPDLWVADGEAPEFQLQNTPTSVTNHFEGRTVWVSKAPWPTNDLVLRRPISWPLLLSGLDGLAASKGFIEYKTAPTLRPSEPVRRALFVGSSPALLLQLEAALIPLNIYLIPAINEEMVAQMRAVSRVSYTFIEMGGDGFDLARVCRAAKGGTEHIQSPRVFLLLPLGATLSRRKAELLGIDEMVSLPLQTAVLRGLFNRKTGSATSLPALARSAPG